MLITVNNKTFHADAKILQGLAVLEDTTKGGFATIHGYKPSTNYVKRPTLNITFTSRFNYLNLLERRLTALKGITIDSIDMSDPKLTKLDSEGQKALFDKAMGELVKSAEKTIQGKRDDAHRQAHDYFYAKISDGVKIHFKTKKVADETVLVLAEDGNPIANNVMIHALEQSRTVVVEGEYKKVNSQAKTLMKKAIEKQLNSRSVGIKTFSLKDDNFDKLTISKNELENA